MNNFWKQYWCKARAGKKCDINFWSNMIILQSHVEKVEDYMNA